MDTVALVTDETAVDEGLMAEFAVFRADTTTVLLALLRADDIDDN